MNRILNDNGEEETPSKMKLREIGAFVLKIYK